MASHKLIRLHENEDDKGTRFIGCSYNDQLYTVTLGTVGGALRAKARDHGPLRKLQYWSSTVPSKRAALRDVERKLQSGESEYGLKGRLPQDYAVQLLADGNCRLSLDDVPDLPVAIRKKAHAISKRDGIPLHELAILGIQQLGRALPLPSNPDPAEQAAKLNVPLGRFTDFLGDLWRIASANAEGRDDGELNGHAYRTYGVPRIGGSTLPFGTWVMSSHHWGVKPLTAGILTVCGEVRIHLVTRQRVIVAWFGEEVTADRVQPHWRSVQIVPANSVKEHPRAEIKDWVFPLTRGL